MDNCSLCDVIIELVDRYITEKQECLHYFSELKKAKEEIATLRQIANLSSENGGSKDE